MAGYDVIWKKALTLIEQELADFQFQIWFKRTYPFLEEDDIYYFEVSNDQHKKIMEQKYADKVQKALQSAYEEINGQPNRNISVCFVSPQEKELYDRAVASEPEAEEEAEPEVEPEREYEPLAPELDLDPFLMEDVEPAEVEEPEAANYPEAPYPPAEELPAPYSPREQPPPPRHVPDVRELASSPASGSEGSAAINPEHTFDTFVVGESNMFASNAALAVANSPGLVYNPLFLYGGVGLGKTHLMHAIANAILRDDPTRKIVYVTSEKFTNELVNMIGRTNANIDMREQFRNKYRRVDVLMIDDIQFIAGKDKTQDEFFHTFNELQTANKQIIISSDRPPKELEQLEERIVSRFEQGLIADIKMPDYETRVAILMKKAERLQRPGSLPIRDEVFYYIASQPNANIRTLEGALKRVIAYTDLNRASLGTRFIDEDLARRALAELFASQKQKNVTPERVLDAVCEFYGVDEKNLRSPRKSKDIVFPRQVAMFIIRDMTELSYSKIAEFFGKKDHTTVMHAEEKIAKAMHSDANIKKDIDDLMARLRNT
ncbi:MAG: chromosomal replication initiator protein DnaA [Clostridia bacterium]|nr:chromosomal replication initiator protein DnaA [Clostridia bacterium]